MAIENQKDVKRYYDDVALTAMMWDPRSKFFHFGYWDEGTRSHHDALLAANRKLTEGVPLGPGVRVLDAGCGWGGSAIWLARTFGVTVHGITLSPRQAEMATQYADAQDLAHLVRFSVQDYTDTSFPDGSFDVVWFQEADTHCLDPLRFYREFYRVLRPGGVLTAAEYWRCHPSYPPRLEAMLREAFELVAAYPPATADKLRQSAEEAGFRDLEMVDWDARMLRSMRRMWGIGAAVYAPTWLVRQLGFVSESHYRSVRSSVLLARSYAERLWTIGRVRGVKPAEGEELRSR